MDFGNNKKEKHKMIYWKYNDERLYPNRGWKSENGINQPPNWQIWSDEYKIGLGLVRVEEDDPVPPEPTYDQLRQVGYGSLGDQLDMIYWDNVNGTSVWQDHIAAVKAEFPKPE
jgi:hypothetical protein